MLVQVSVPCHRYHCCVPSPPLHALGAPFHCRCAHPDILEGDPLGGVNISEEGVIERDRFVFETAFSRGINICMVCGPFLFPLMLCSFFVSFFWFSSLWRPNFVVLYCIVLCCVLFVVLLLTCFPLLTRSSLGDTNAVPAESSPPPSAICLKASRTRCSDWTIQNRKERNEVGGGIVWRREILMNSFAQEKGPK